MDRLAEEGMREYEIGETINATSLKKLLNYMERRIKEVEYSKNFLKSLRKLPVRIIDKAEEKEKIFKENPFHPVLKTHKLSGKERSLGILDKSFLSY